MVCTLLGFLIEIVSIHEIIEALDLTAFIDDAYVDIAVLLFENDNHYKFIKFSSFFFYYL